MTDIFKQNDPTTFTSPEQLPACAEEAKSWQEANYSFWESNPMRYDWKQAVEVEPFSRSFYKEIDTRFFFNVWEYMPWGKVPFDNLIDFEALSGKKVLEIGVGMGSHAQILAEHAGSYTGIDITEYATKATSERLKLFDLRGEVFQMDAEKLAFPDASFDTVWSWGVIHHSSNTQQIIREMHRVLKPGGEAIIMVYHRGWWNYYLLGGLIHGIIRGGLFRTGSLHKTLQSVTDGALARYYTARSWRGMIGGLFRVDYIVIKGSKPEVFPLPSSRLKSALMAVVPNSLTRFMTNSCGMGSFLVSRLVKMP
jgi:ubiquinone/menaquinone biosynthesis C-methylase UbiE